MKDFFISYNSADLCSAEWIAWVLEEKGYSVIIQAWDFRPGGNFVLYMQQAAAEAKRTVMVLSDAYLKALYTHSEWAAAFKQDPTSRERKLLPIRVEPCHPTGILASLVYVDLVGKSEADAEQLLLDALKDRDKPSTRPTFNQSVPDPQQQANSHKVNSSPRIQSQKNTEKVSRRIFNIRQQIINKVESSIDHQLEINLIGEPITLSFEVRKDLVQQAFTPKLGKSGGFKSMSDVSIPEIFEDPTVSRKLLILGQPGSGKTIAMLRLAKYLLDFCKDDFKAPIPLFLELSTWNKKSKESIVEWIKSESRKIYKISEIDSSLIFEKINFIPLLDGLDELDLSQHVNCLKAINIFIRKEEILSNSLVVSSRLEEYNRCYLKLELNAAISLQPIEMEKIEKYFLSINEEVLYSKIVSNSKLKQLAGTPLFLFIMISLKSDIFSIDTQIKGNKIIDIAKPPAEIIREKLFDLYITRKLRSPEPEIEENKHQYEASINETINWLSFLAEYLQFRSSSIFLIESLQPSCLKKRKEKLLYRLLIFAQTTIFSFPLCVSIVFFLHASRRTYKDCPIGEKCNLILSLSNSNEVLIITLLGALMSIILGIILGIVTKEIEPVEKLLPSLRVLLRTLKIAGIKERLLSILVVNILRLPDVNAAVNSLKPLRERQGNPTWLGHVIRTMCLTLFLALFPVTLPFRIFSDHLRKVNFDIDKRVFPNQAIWKNTINIFMCALIFSPIGFLIGLSIGIIDHDLTDKIFCLNTLDICLTTHDISSALIGFSVALLTGTLLPGIASIQHLSLRITLWYLGYSPWNYRSFLDCASRKIILQKIGGRYQFIHDLLRLHFIRS